MKNETSRRAAAAAAKNAPKIENRWTRGMVEMLVDGDVIDFGLGRARITSMEQLNPIWAREYAPHSTILVEVHCLTASGGTASVCLFDGCSFAAIRPVSLAWTV